MGIFDKVKNKIANKLEESAVSNMTAEEKAAYEQEKADRKPITYDIEKLSMKFAKEDTKDLGSLLDKLGALDERKLWVGGFLKKRDNENTLFANLFSGYKNLKILALNKDVYYMIGFQQDEIYSYKAFKKDQIYKVTNKDILHVRLHDQTSMKLAVSKNKQRLNELYNTLK